MACSRQVAVLMSAAYLMLLVSGPCLHAQLCRRCCKVLPSCFGVVGWLNAGRTMSNLLQATPQVWQGASASNRHGEMAQKPWQGRHWQHRVPDPESFAGIRVSTCCSIPLQIKLLLPGAGCAHDASPTEPPGQLSAMLTAAHHPHGCQSLCLPACCVLPAACYWSILPGESPQMCCLVCCSAVCQSLFDQCPEAADARVLPHDGCQWLWHCGCQRAGHRLPGELPSCAQQSHMTSTQMLITKAAPPKFSLLPMCEQPCRASLPFSCAACHILPGASMKRTLGLLGPPATAHIQVLDCPYCSLACSLDSSSRATTPPCPQVLVTAALECPPAWSVPLLHGA